MRFRLALAALLIAPAAAAQPDAAAEKVAYPEGFETGFLRYATVDKPDRGTVRYMYVARPAWEAAAPGAPLPEEAVVVMEDHRARLGADEAPVLDAEGRMIPTDEVTNVFVMEKRAGWGDGIPEALRNGDWLYAWFGPDGARRDKPLSGCYECHKAQADADYTFTTLDAVERLKR